MPETMHEDFSTALLCLYFGLLAEGRFDAEQPRVYFAPCRKESQPWSELFSLGGGTEVWMSHLTRPLHPRCAVTEERWQHYNGLKPDVWIQDDGHAIMIENKTRGGRHGREHDYLNCLREDWF